MNSTTGKADRLLQIYSRLVNGEILSKKEMADRFHITERSVQRDVEALRCYFQEEGLNQDVIHDRKAGGYRLQKEEKSLLNNGEILAVCKILLESRSMKREEMFPILEKLTSSCVPPKSRAAVDSLISNEKFITSNHITENPSSPVSGTSRRPYRITMSWRSSTSA